MARATKHTLSEKAKKALTLFEETTQYHTSFMDKARKRYRSYLGILDVRTDAADWTSQLAPPYVRNNVETQLAALVAEKLAFKVTPRPKFYDPEEFEQARQGAKAHEILHRCQFANDRIDEKQRPFALQNSIVGFTVAKNFWRSEMRRTKQLQMVDVGEQEYGYPTGIYDLVEAEYLRPDFFGPTTEVVNVEDFFWHEAAVEVQRSPILAHRVWMHFSELKEAERQGVFSNVDELKDSRDQGSDGQLFDSADSRNRTKDMIEVIEIWFREPEGIHVCTIGNRKVELSTCKPNPFWHGEYPFVIAATEPDLFQIAGLSQVAKTAHLQEAVWDFLNQTADNTRLQNNWILGVNTAMVPDWESMEHAPGERWLVENGDVNQAIMQFKPDTTTAQLAMPMIGMLERHIQNLGGTQPFTTTSEAGRIGANTATEAALVSNIAQQSVKMQQMQLLLGWERVGQQRTELNKQFIRTPQLVSEVGLDKAEEQQVIAPMIIQGDYSFDISPMAESLMRSERRAEANALIQTFGQLAPIWLSMAQAGAATLPNFDAFAERWLEGYDENPPQFFSQKPPPQQPMPAQGQPQQQGAPQNGQPAGMTAPQSIDPAISPSAQISVAPSQFMARMGSMSGGVSNT